MKKILTASLLIALLGNTTLLTAEAHAATTTKPVIAQKTTLEQRIAALEKLLTAFTAKAAKTHEELVVDAVNKNLPSVVSIIATRDVPLIQFSLGGRSIGTTQATERTQVGAGTGFIITKSGYIATNKHVINDATLDYTVILNTGEKIPAKIMYRDAEYDVALLKITTTKNLPVATLGESKTLKLGQTGIAIGNALGQFDNSISSGIISGLNRNIQATDNTGKAENLVGVIQTDAAINPGNSGGPLVNIRGEVVGINVATVIGSQNISFSLPIDVVKKILDQLPLF